MASRSNTPANPTLQGTTDDASRGGLFARSNVANPVSGADINGVAINDSTITVDINGTTQSFMLNQANDQTLTFSVASAPAGGGGSGIFSSATFDGNILILNGIPPQSAITVDLNLYATQAALNDLRGMIPTTIGQLSDVADGLGTAGQVLSVNMAGNALEYTDPSAATVSLASFSNEGNVDFTNATTGNAIQANAVLDFRSTRAGDAAGTFNSLAIDENLDFRFADNSTGFLSFVPDGEGGIILQRRSAIAPPASRETPVAPTNIFTPSIPMTTVTISGGTRNGNPTGTLTGNGVTDSNIMIAPGGTDTMVTVSFPDSNELGPGDYTLTTMQPVTPTAPDGPTSVTSSTEVNRFIPFYQSRNPLTTPAQVLAATASSGAWNGRMTSIAGSGPLYFAVEMSRLPAATPDTRARIIGFPVQYISEPGLITVTGAGQTQMYRIFAFTRGVSANTEIIF